MAAVFGLTCQLGVKRHWACLPAALWGTGTLPILNSGFADVDLVLAAWYLISTWFLVRYARGYKPGDLVCGALAMGAALGTKYIAILFVPALLLFAGIAIGRSEQRWSHGLLLVVGVTLPAAFWYVRNALLTGNPLYPLHQEVLGFPILRGWYRREALFSSEYHIPVTNWSALLLLLLRGMDPILVPFWLTGLVAAVCAAWRNRLLPILLVAIALLHLTVFWAINPYQTQDRFLFAAFALLAIPVALQFERVPLLSVPFAGLLGWHLVVGPQSLVEWIRAVMGIDSSRLFWPPLLPAPLHIVAESWSATLSNRVIVGRFALLVAIMVAAAIGSVAFRPTNRRVAWAIASGVVALAGIGFRAYYSWVPEDYSRFRFIPYAPQIGYTPGWLILDELSRRPLRVAYAGTNLPFYLFGSRLQNDVHYVNINGHGPFLMHDYHKLFMAHGEFLARSSTPDWDRREADEMAWLQNLRDQRINLLFLGFVNRAGGAHNFYDRDGFPIERTWADRHPEIFHPIHTDARTRLYAVRFQADPAPERP
jgi:hypothetical protein